MLLLVICCVDTFSASEGAGVELIQLIRLAFSVLNRLLLLRPENSPSSPVEQFLSASPANRFALYTVKPCN